VNTFARDEVGPHSSIAKVLVVCWYWHTSLCAGTGTRHCHVVLSMQRNLTQSWVRSRLYMTCNILNNLLIQYSNVGCFSPNIIRVQFLGGEGRTCSLNGVECKYV
jgi:hypothetical protein